MKTGLESLDTGAPEITYSGNQGPKSPQEDQQKMAEFQLQEYMEEFERVFPDMKDKRGTPDYMKELQDYFEGLASKQSEGIGDMAMKSGLIDEYRNYKMGQEDAGEPFMSPRDYYRSLEQDRMGVKEGGVMQLVKENKNGSRPGYRGDDAARSERSYGASSRADPGSAPQGDGPATNAPSQDRIAEIKQANITLENLKKDKIEENLEKFRDLNSKTRQFQNFALKFSPVAMFASKFGPLNNKDFFTDKVLGSKNFSNMTKEQFANLTNEEQEEMYDNYMSGRMSGATDAYGNPIGRGDGDGPPIILPMTTGMATGEDVDITDTDTTDFVSNFAPVTSFPFADYRGGIEVPAADGGRIGYADGGITDLRQGYFLGKLVKKATRAVKKIVKSPLGKAALIGGLGYFAGGGGNPFTAIGRGKFDFANLLSLKNNRLLSSVKDGERAFNPFKAIGLTSMLPLLMGQEEEDNLDDATGQASRGPRLDISGIRKQALAGNLNPADFPFMNPSYYAADGGRIGLAAGGIGDLRGALSKEMFNLGEDQEDEIKKLAMGGSAGMPPVTMQPGGQDAQSFSDDESTGIAQATPTTTLPNQMPIPRPMMDPRMMQQMMMAQRGNSMINRGMPMMGGRMMAQEGGMMDMGGMEKDYRNEGGFVPIGGQERADDVPARLSKNEFVFTADAVRNAGGGDIDKGAEIMENMMENLEAGGKVSKGSQGLSGAREMFATQQRLGEVL